MRWLSIGCALACALSAAGCDECERGTSRCDGARVLEQCASSCSEPGCQLEWQPERCQGVCLEQAAGDALCVESGTPHPRCEQRSGFCDEDLVVVCAGPFIVRRFPCPAGEHCLEGAATPDAGPDFACAPP